MVEFGVGLAGISDERFPAQMMTADAAAAPPPAPPPAPEVAAAAKGITGGGGGQEGVVPMQNGGEGVHAPAPAENGFGAAEKGMRAGEAAAEVHPSPKRTLQDFFEAAPPRKRMRAYDAAEVDDEGGEEEEGVAAQGGNLGGDSSQFENGGGLGARVPPTPVRTEANGAAEGGTGKLGIRQDELEVSAGEEEGFDGPVHATDMEVDVAVELGEEGPLCQQSMSRVDVPEEEAEPFSAPPHTSDPPVGFGLQVGHGSQSRDDDRSGGDGRLAASAPEPSAPPAGHRVEFIDLDDSEDDEEEEESDGTSTRGMEAFAQQQQQQEQLQQEQRQHQLKRRGRGYSLRSSESTAGSYSREDEEDSDSDDCRVIGSTRAVNPGQRRESPERPLEAEDGEDSVSTSDSDSSAEVIGGSQGEIRRQWEQAAMRRRMGRTMRSEGSKANGVFEVAVNLDDDRTESQGLAESVATSTYHGSPDSKDQTETSEARRGPEGIWNSSDARRGPSPVGVEEELLERRRQADDVSFSFNSEAANGLNTFVSPEYSGQPEKSVNPTASNRESLARNAGHGDSNGATVDVLYETARPESVQEARFPGANGGGDDSPQDERVAYESSRNETRVDTGDRNVTSDQARVDNTDEDVIAAREKLKQTAHYRKTNEAEWASRQQEIQRQAAEAKRLRQRKRLEADRKKDMERKQRERIEELRLSQMKEERSMGVRDQIRGKIATELERVALNCPDLATLLRKLGIVVDGGHAPSVAQVNAAYKKALFKFHPDRAVASSKGDPQQQVEAEEKFKLILKSKDTLRAVANDYKSIFR